MPSAAEHQAKANHNLAFLSSIKDPAYGDWMAVVIFYAAVHLVEKVFAITGDHSKDHAERNMNVRRRLKQIHRHFRALYNLSLVSRYQEASKFGLSPSDVQTILIDTHLKAIQTFVAAVSPPSAAPPGT
jgi:hypothetical protein